MIDIGDDSLYQLKLWGRQKYYSLKATALGGGNLLNLI